MKKALCFVIALLFLSFAPTGKADFAPGYRVPAPTATGQMLMSYALPGGALAWGPAVPSTVSGTVGGVVVTNGIVTGLSTPAMRTMRVPVPATLAGAVTTLSVVWPKAFADTNYSIAPGVYDPAGLLGVVDITAVSATGCTVAVKNVGLSALTGGTAQVELTATHD